MRQSPPLARDIQVEALEAVPISPWLILKVAARLVARSSRYQGALDNRQRIGCYEQSPELRRLSRPLGPATVVSYHFSG